MSDPNFKAGYKHFVAPVPINENYLDSLTLIAVKTIDEVREIFTKNSNQPHIALDFETSGLDADKDFIVGYSVSFDGNTGYYVPINHAYDLKLGSEALDILYDHISKPSVRTFYFNARFDMRFFEYAGYDLSKTIYYDVAIGCYHADSNWKESSLKSFEKHFLGWLPKTFKDTVGDTENFYYLTVDEGYQYACLDACGTFKLAQVTLKYYAEAKLSGKLDNESLYPLMHYENTPVLVDKQRLSQMIDQANARLIVLEHEMYKISGTQFSINSNVQFGNVLRNLGIDTGEYTKTGQMKVDIATLETLNLSNPHPILTKKIEHSQILKFLSSYLETTDEYLKTSDRDSCRFQYYSTRVPSGRFASSGGDKKKGFHFFQPINIQSAPKPDPCMWYVHEDTEKKYSTDEIVLGYRFSVEDKSDWMVEGLSPKDNFRSIYIAPEDFYFVSCDYSAEELKIACNYANEDFWIKVFQEGGDLHKETAIKMFGEQNYDKEKRKKAKIMNFSALYGATEYSIANTHNIPLSQAKEMFEAYWNSIPKIKAFRNYQVNFGKKHGTVYNFFGRPRRVRYWLSSNEPRDRAFGERTVLNTLIQSAGADILKTALIKLWRNLFNHPQYKDKAKFQIMVHDEINSIIHKENIEDMIKIKIDNMTMKFNGWALPLTVGLEIGNSWGLTFPFELKGGKLIPKS